MQLQPGRIQHSSNCRRQDNDEQNYMREFIKEELKKRWWKFHKLYEIAAEK